jgi:hypothetical protein
MSRIILIFARDLEELDEASSAAPRVVRIPSQQ